MSKESAEVSKAKKKAASTTGMSENDFFGGKLGHHLLSIPWKLSAKDKRELLKASPINPTKMTHV